MRYNGPYKFVNKEIDIISLFQGMSINMYKYIFVVFKVFFYKKIFINKLNYYNQANKQRIH